MKSKIIVKQYCDYHTVKPTRHKIITVVMNGDEIVPNNVYTILSAHNYGWDWQISCGPNHIRYYMLYGSVTKEVFIDSIRKEYPNDFEWLLFHPEIFLGEYVENS